MSKAWKVLSRRTVYSGAPFVEVSVEDVELPDGRVVRGYHQIRTGSFATIVPETDDGRFVFLRQYRHGVRRVGLGLPGGRVEPGEAPEAAARRELLEETGFTARAWRPVSSYDTSCTYGFSRNLYFHAKGVERIQAPDSDDLEQGEIVMLDHAEALAALRAGEILSLGHAGPLAFVLLDYLAPGEKP